MTGIRPARADEIDEIYAVHRASVTAQCAGHYPSQQIALWLEGRTPAMYLAAITRGQLWVATDAGTELIAGFAEIAGAELTKLFVAGDHAGGGVGRGLLATAIAAIAATGSPAVELEATHNAVRFYQRHGFVEVGPGQLALGASGVVLALVRMRRDLRSAPA